MTVYFDTIFIIIIYLFIFSCYYLEGAYTIYNIPNI